jgi:hypothetical protein
VYNGELFVTPIIFPAESHNVVFVEFGFNGGSIVCISISIVLI